ncbi:hypothetical protein HMPREF0791_1633 [Staphylococcus epidermidis W23144]|uniref:hypothetical protein n=2 Tax=Staphylococcus epidermidis TaxID=1282 RepID=UPI0001A96352|nr:hypothetical protein [Staphylococcus epidermidis]EES35767.1 hypothetical protein HMPREF0791_1633 [Staphylococcus epidermidis W23144]
MNIMNIEFLGSIYTLAGGVALYSIKEFVKYFSDSKLHRKKLNLEKLYPIYLECFKKARTMINSYFINKEKLDLNDIEISAGLNDVNKESYDNDINYRQRINLSNKVKNMEALKNDFSDVFNINKIFFNNDFVAKTFDIINEFERDISYLKNIITNMENSNEYFKIESFITPEYQRKINDYIFYLDQFEDEFKKHFKINRLTWKEKIRIWKSKRNK